MRGRLWAGRFVSTATLPAPPSYAPARRRLVFGWPLASTPPAEVPVPLAAPRQRGTSLPRRAQPMAAYCDPGGPQRSDTLCPDLVPGECGEGAVWVAAATTAWRPDFCVGCPALSPLARLVLLHRLRAASTRPRGFALERGCPRAARAGSTLGRYPFVKSKTVVLAGGVGRNSCRACLRVREHAHDVGVALRTGARRP